MSLQFITYFTTGNVSMYQILDALPSQLVNTYVVVLVILVRIEFNQLYRVSDEESAKSAF